jgi:hypothetical protein
MAGGVVVVVGAVIFGGSRVLGKIGGGSKDKSSQYLVYFTEDEAMLANLKALKKDPAELTSKLTDGYSTHFYGFVYDDCVTKDGKYAYYYERYDSSEGNLYRVPVSKIGKEDAAVKVSSSVSDYTILNNNGAVYMKGDSVYYFDGKESAQHFGRDVNRYYLDKNQKYLCWSQSEDDGTKTYYYQDLKGKKDKVKLCSGITGGFYCNKDLTEFYALKDEKLIKVNNKGEEEKIDGGVAGISSADANAGKIIYYKNDTQSIRLADVVYDDTHTMSEYNKESLKTDTADIDIVSLYYYADGKTTEITSKTLGSRNGSKGTYCVYQELPDTNDLRVPWSEYNNRGVYAVREAWEEAASTCLFSSDTKKSYKLTLQYEEDGSIENTSYNVDSNMLYYTEVDTNHGDVSLVGVSVAGKDVGKQTVYCKDAEDIRLEASTKDGIYYITDYGKYGGTLYLNNKQIADDVNDAVALGNSKVLLSTDQRNGSFDLQSSNGKKNEEVASDVAYASGSSDGTIVYISDYSSSRNSGDLNYYDGKKSHKISSDVTGYAVPDGSKTIQ